MDHLAKDAIPAALSRWIDAPYPWWKEEHMSGDPFRASKEERERTSGIRLFEDLTLVQHAQVINILKEEVEGNTMFFTVLEQTPRPKTGPHGGEGHRKHRHKKKEDADSSDGDNNKEISLDEVGSIPTRVLNFARLYGVKGGEIESFVRHTAEEAVANAFTEACIHTAGYAVFHAAQYFVIKCLNDEHHKERIEKMARLAAEAEAEAKAEAAEEAAKEEAAAASATAAAAAAEGGGKGTDLEAAPSPPKIVRKNRRTSLGISADVLDSLESANDLKQKKFTLHHSEDPVERLASCLALCAEHDIDGANWHYDDHDMWTPLMVAAYNANVEAVKILLSDGRAYGDGRRWTPANWDTINCYGETTLHLLAYSTGGKEDSKQAKAIVKRLLLEAGARNGDLAQQNESLRMALHARTYPNGSRVPGKNKMHKDLVYVYGRKAAEDELFEEHERDRKTKCCGIRAPFLAGLFNMIDQPMREINRFFSRTYANGGYSVLEYAKQSGNLRNFKQYVKKVGMETTAE